MPEFGALTGADPRSVTHDRDLALVRTILAGDARAWEGFVKQYAGLLYSVVRRHLRSRDADEIRTVMVDVLVSLRRSKLATYQGRAALSTWLTLVARSAALDTLRKRFGRGQDIRGCEQLSAVEKRLFQLHHVEGRSYREVIAELADGESWSVDRYIAAVHRIEQKLGERWLRRHAYDSFAHSVGASSGRMLEYLDHVREEFTHQAGGHSPEYHVLEREARETARRLNEVIEELEPAERRILHMRFEQGWTAREIADELGLPGARGVYTILERVVRRLRRWFDSESAR